MKLSELNIGGIESSVISVQTFNLGVKITLPRIVSNQPPEKNKVPTVGNPISAHITSAYT